MCFHKIYICFNCSRAIGEDPNKRLCLLYSDTGYCDNSEWELPSSQGGCIIQEEPRAEWCDACMKRNKKVSRHIKPFTDDYDDEKSRY
jgi:hypothetical protein